MPHIPDNVHDTHDLELVAAHAAGDAQGPALERATALVAACTECAALHHDLRAIAAAMPELPAPVRPRDFRLTPEQAASLRPSGIRGLLAAFSGPRFAFATPLGTGLAALGIVGVLVASGGFASGGTAGARDDGAAVDRPGGRARAERGCDVRRVARRPPPRSRHPSSEALTGVSQKSTPADPAAGTGPADRTDVAADASTTASSPLGALSSCWSSWASRCSAPASSHGGPPGRPDPSIPACAAWGTSGARSSSWQGHAPHPRQRPRHARPRARRRPRGRRRPGSGARAGHGPRRRLHRVRRPPPRPACDRRRHARAPGARPAPRLPAHARAGGLAPPVRSPRPPRRVLGPGSRSRRRSAPGSPPWASWASSSPPVASHRAGPLGHHPLRAPARPSRSSPRPTARPRAPRPRARRRTPRPRRPPPVPRPPRPVRRH